MQNKNNAKREYRNIAEFIALVAERELESFIIDARYTSAFNYRMKKLVEEIKNSGKQDVEFSVLFNTKGEVAIISPVIVGDFVSDTFTALMEEYYKRLSLDNIIKKVIEGNEKVRKDFITVTYKTLYKVFDELYEEIKCRKDIMYRYMMNFRMTNPNIKNIPLKVCVLLVLEDICKYMGVDREYIIENTRELVN